ncbi:MAG: phosphodiester glycosidase family protein [Candidatus Gastranaerophilales bacterium]|nr:phosphodiester glycosidase family protein [Candidatus Gastranaerophilales bacterium]
MSIRKLLLLFFLTLSVAATCCFGQDIICEHSDGIYHIVIPVGTKIEFISKSRLMTNEEVHKELGAILTVNAGFFDPKNQKTISFVYNDGILQESPIENENLVFNETIMDNWSKVSNRTEFRVTLHNGLTCYDIAPHNDPYKGRLIASAQAGPMLLPELKLEDEFFVVKDSSGKVTRESASVLHKTARTLIGIKDGNVHIFIVTNEHPMTIYEARDLCKSYGMEKAMAFDGGSSTSLDYKDEIHVTSAGIKTDDTGRKLKSFLVIKSLY